MSCSSPRRAWLFDDGCSRAVVFRPPTDWMAGLSSPVDLPCRKCLSCRASASLIWSVRAYHEASLHKQNAMVTLTYSDEHVPKKIEKKHLQDFMKRARHKAHFRYFACGERGGLTGRPHFHVLFFGCDWLGGSKKSLTGHDRSPALDELWPFGTHDIVPLSLPSIMYVCGYEQKKVADVETWKTQSNRPGIGHGWLDKYCDDLARTGEVVINGQKFPIPARYLEWEPDYLEHQKIARARYARAHPISAAAREASALINARKFREQTLLETKK